MKLHKPQCVIGTVFTVEVLNQPGETHDYVFDSDNIPGVGEGVEIEDGEYFQYFIVMKVKWSQRRMLLRPAWWKDGKLVPKEASRL